jgi:putative FmdB family regulatory protein
VPTYQYACTTCGHQLEAVQSFADEPLTHCPACSGRLRKLFSAVGIVFKGSGFYRNDSRVTAADGDGSPSTPAKKGARGDGSSSAPAKERASGDGSSSSDSSSGTSGGAETSSTSGSRATSSKSPAPSAA